MSSLVFARDCETLTDLIAWVQGQIPNALIVETEGEIIIQTRLTTSMGGYLHPIDEEEEEWDLRANLTHAEQLDQFGWCVCEGTNGKGQMAEDCPREGEE